MLNFKNQIYENNNILISDVVNRLENIIKDIEDNIIITKNKDIIIIMNKIINNNKQIKKEIKQFNYNNNQNFKDSENNINEANISIPLYDNEGYEGELKNRKIEEKGIYYYNIGKYI